MEAFNDIIGGMDLGSKSTEGVEEVISDVEKHASKKKVTNTQDSITVLTYEKGELINEERKPKKNYE